MLDRRMVRQTTFRSSAALCVASRGRNLTVLKTDWHTPCALCKLSPCQVNLGHSVVVNAGSLQYVSRVDVTKTTYTLCEVVFSRHALANSSRTGRKSNAFLGLPLKEKLDENKVQAVVGRLMFIFIFGKISKNYLYI